MPTRAAVEADIASKITDKTPSDKVINTEDGANRNLILDYIDQEVGTKQDELVSGTNIKTLNGESLLGSGNIAISGGATKTSGSITLSATPQVLPYDTNSCSFTGGIAYLPATTEINKEIYVIATANNIEIRANVANTNKMFVTFNTFVSNVILTTNQMYRFIYIGFATEGYWKAEQI